MSSACRNCDSKGNAGGSFYCYCLGRGRPLEGIDITSKKASDDRHADYVIKEESRVYYRMLYSRDKENS